MGKEGGVCKREVRECGRKKGLQNGGKGGGGEGVE